MCSFHEASIVTSFGIFGAPDISMGFPQNLQVTAAKAIVPRIISESERFWNTHRLTHNRIPLFNLLQDAQKHRLHVETTVVPEAVFVQVGL
jgi:hypothetical protein